MPLLWSELITEELSYKSVDAWLANEPQQLYYQFTTSKDGSQGESIVMRSFHWRPPDDPIPQGSQPVSYTHLTLPTTVFV